MSFARPAIAVLLLGAALPVVVFAGPPPKAKPPVKAGASPAAEPAAATSTTLKDVEKAMTQKRYEAVLAYAKANPKAEDSEEAWKTAIDLAEGLELWAPVAEHADVFLAAFPKSGDVMDVWISKAGALGKIDKRDAAKTAYAEALKLLKVGETHPQIVWNVYHGYSSFLADIDDLEGAKKALDDVVALYKDNADVGSQVKREADNAMAPLALLGAEPPALDDEVKDLDGKPLKYADFKGKLLLIDFWATWCGPCRGEMPNVVAAYKKFHDKGFEILGVSLDKEGQEKAVKEFNEKNGMTWRQYFDGQGWGNKIAQLFSVHGIPQTFLVGKDGKVVKFGLRGPALEREIEKRLK